MRVINFGQFREIPVSVRVVYAFAVICALIGLVTMLLDMLGVAEIRLAVSMAFIAAGCLMNTIVMSRYKEILFR